MMRNCYLSFIGVVCLASICFTPLLCPTIAFSLPEDCAVLGADDSTDHRYRAQLGHRMVIGYLLIWLTSQRLSICRHMNTLVMRLLLSVSVFADSGLKLTCGTDYEVFYANNVAPGCADIAVNGLGDYAGATTRLSFQIVRSSDNKIALPGSWVCRKR